MGEDRRRDLNSQARSSPKENGIDRHAARRAYSPAPAPSRAGRRQGVTVTGPRGRSKLELDRAVPDPGMAASMGMI